jgi:hypothetical protein
MTGKPSQLGSAANEEQTMTLVDDLISLERVNVLYNLFYYIKVCTPYNVQSTVSPIYELQSTATNYS